MTLTLVLAATALFFLVLERSGIIGLSYRVLAESNSALQLVTDPHLDDNAKEVAVRRMAVQMLRLSGEMLVRGLAVVLVPGMLVYAAVLAGATDMESVWRIALSWPLVLINVLIFLFVLFWQRRA